MPAADRPPGLGQRLGIRGAGRVQAATRGVRALVPHFHFFERCGFWCPEGSGGKVRLISWREGRFMKLKFLVVELNFRESVQQECTQLYLYPRVAARSGNSTERFFRKTQFADHRKVYNENNKVA